MWAGIFRWPYAEAASFLCSHLWGLPGWSSLTSSPSHCNNPQGLSYLLCMQAANELNQGLLDWPPHSLTDMLAVTLIFLTDLSTSIITLTRGCRTPEAKPFFFAAVSVQGHWMERKVAVSLWLKLSSSGLMESTLVVVVFTECILLYFELCS